MSALGHKQTCALHQPMSAIPPIATAKANFRKKAMSALPPKADMCSALAHVCFGPKADSCSAAKSYGDIARSDYWPASSGLFPRIPIIGANP
jgi:hypothetical protein